MEHRHQSTSKNLLLHGFRLLSFLLLISAADVNAKPAAMQPYEVRRVAVPLRDLDLDSAQGAAVLLSRLRKAARQVCEVHGRRDIATRSEESRCRDEALERAVRSLVTVNGTFRRGSACASLGTDALLRSAASFAACARSSGARN